jgi:two-component system LytT family response regulator
MKVLIIDDERLARSEMKRLLKAHPEIEIVGEASSSQEALRLATKLEPELLFLDVQLGGATGFDLLSKIPAPAPKVIFTTAHDEYAVQAFGVNALDYLLKPIEPNRLTEALLRAIGPNPNESPEIDGEGKFNENDRVFIRADNRCWFMPLRDIHLLESDGNYTRVYFAIEKALVYRSLNALEERLPEALFLRANRSQILNLSCIENLENWFSGNLKAKIRGGLEIEISRRQSQIFRARTAL